MGKTVKDGIAGMAKDKLVAEYKRKASELAWYQRLENLRANGANPVVVLDMNFAEYDEPDWTITAEVFAPMAADGGVLRLVQQMKGQRTYADVVGYEDWIDAKYRREESQHQPVYMRVFAERLMTAVNRRFPKAA